MPKSQNGYEVLKYGDKRLVNIPKIRGKVLAGPVAAVLSDLVSMIDTTVEDIDAGQDDWGHAYREIRGGSSWSNHASGTAIDINADRHPLGKRGTWTQRQASKINAMLKDRYADGGRPVVRWGENYSTRVDGMHFEIDAGIAAVSRVAQRLLAAGSRASATLPNTKEWPLNRRTVTYTAIEASVKRGIVTESMQTVQIILGNLVNDGKWGPKTRARLVAVCKARGIPYRTSTGEPTRDTITRLCSGKVKQVR